MVFKLTPFSSAGKRLTHFLKNALVPYVVKLPDPSLTHTAKRITNEHDRILYKNWQNMNSGHNASLNVDIGGVLNVHKTVFPSLPLG